MSSNTLWIVGGVRSGKTTRLVQQYHWLQARLNHARATPNLQEAQQATSSVLVVAANAGNRANLEAQITQVIAGRYPVNSTTPLGFFQDEVVLFWPLLVQELNLTAQFPLRLRPETEQALATRLWQESLSPGGPLHSLHGESVSTYRRVRQALDLLQIAALSGTTLEEISTFLQAGFAAQEIPTSVWDRLGEVLVGWREWCLSRALLTYGIIAELYWRYLLPHRIYREQLQSRYWAVIADDVDNYPAIARDLFELLLDQGAVGAFTYNPEGGTRLGLGADPQYLSGLSHRCTLQQLDSPTACLGQTLAYPVDELLSNPALSLPEGIQSIQTSSRAELLRRTGETIIQAVQAGQVKPVEIAVIGPGLDAIARYTLIEILAQAGIAVESLNDQRPLASSPMIRALLTLLALVYPGLGRLVNRDDVAEMLIVLSMQRNFNPVGADIEARTAKLAAIDPVRAGLLADYCFEPHPERPRLLDATVFPRWDRLGYQAKRAYDGILAWLTAQRSQQEQGLTFSAIAVLDRAIQQFLWPHNLSYDQLAGLRELIETAQHYWEVDTRLRQQQVTPHLERTPTSTVASFIQLLRGGTITANPFPVQRVAQQRQAVTLATTFQYRSVRQAHRWHFWLDTGSSLWHGGGAVVLWGAPFFLKSWSGQAWTTAEKMVADQEQLRRLLLDLLSRVSERVYLCHSDLSVSGQEQVGPLLPLVDASVPLTSA